MYSNSIKRVHTIGMDVDDDDDNDDANGKLYCIGKSSSEMWSLSCSRCC